jgi:chemotaxis protein CheZ
MSAEAVHADLSHDTVEQERRDLLRYVLAVRHAIAELRPNDVRTRQLPSAMSEIGLIVETTENAANEIMQSIEEVMALAPDLSVDDYRAAVEERCITVMTACSFQDLTGQRINKVVEMLLKLENRLAALSEVLGEPADEAPVEEPAAAKDILLNGPAAPGEGVDQSEIDKLFA